MAALLPTNMASNAEEAAHANRFLRWRRRIGTDVSMLTREDGT